MNKKWMPITAGSLLIVSGVIQLAFGIIFLSPLFIGRHGSDAMGWYSLLALMFGPLTVTGAFTLVGGIYALKRKKWPLALAGSIFTLTPFAIWVRVVCLPYYTMRDLLFLGVASAIFLAIGITAITLIALSRKEFKGKQVTG